MVCQTAFRRKRNNALEGLVQTPAELVVEPSGGDWRLEYPK